MRAGLGLSLLFFLSVFTARTQDTFSILAFDSITREVGGAGASCVDLNQTPYHDHFIIELFPDTGAIATQAQYLPVSQINARNRLRAGDSPLQMMAWLSANIPSPHLKQWGAVKLGEVSAAYTGTGCTDYKNHVVGPNYSIQGNILLGQHVLDSIEARFLRQEGDLACKLMAAMQGAKIPGADSRCLGNNSSSLFAFLKVSQPTDVFGQPSLLVSLRTAYGDSIEPIDSLQKLFDFVHTACPMPTVTAVSETRFPSFRVYPNPAGDKITLDGLSGHSCLLRISNVLGTVVFEGSAVVPATLDIHGYGPGMYFMRVEMPGGVVSGTTFVVAEP